jgi:uncharacterized protein DUF6445
MFNPHATLQVVNLDDKHVCLVVDDALLEPERLVQFAAARREAFRPVDFSVYPGVYLMPPADVVNGLNELFRQQVRRLFDARRCVAWHIRFSLVTLPPQDLQPCQWLCHVDDLGLDPRLSMQACVLYLFKDEGLGGTSFYAPIRSEPEMAALYQDANTLSGAAFTQRYGIRAGYMHESNDYFTRIGRISAKWNRLIFYDGTVPHSGDIFAPDRLSEDPVVGRLTLNGFFTCRRNLA